MRRNTLITALSVLLVMAAVSQSTQSAGLKATEVAACVGRTVTLPCYSTERLGVDWLNPSNDHVVSSGYVQNEYKNRFSLNQTAKHQHSLVISGLRSSDQGSYVCVEDAGLGPRHLYRLTVHACQSRLVVSSFPPIDHDEIRRNTTLVGVALLISILVVLAAAATVALWTCIRRDSRERPHRLLAVH